jgi:hypothetical protein
MKSVLATSVLATLVAVSCLLTAASVLAQEDAGAQVCVAAFDSAQTSREQGKLMHARNELITCAQAQCPAIIQAKCSEWLGDLDRELPSVIVAVEPVPADPAATQVSIDGAAVEGGLTGRPVKLDPGPHRIRVTFSDGKVEELDIVIAHGEQNRKIVVSIAVAPDPAPGPREAAPLQTETGISPLVWIGFGVAAASAIAGGITGGIAIATANRVEDACGGFSCDASHEADLDTGEALSHVSTVSFAMAGAGVVVGVVGLFLPTEEPVAVGVTPWLGYGTVGLRGSF